MGHWSVTLVQMQTCSTACLGSKTWRFLSLGPASIAVTCGFQTKFAARKYAFEVGAAAANKMERNISM